MRSKSSRDGVGSIREPHTEGAKRGLATNGQIGREGKLIAALRDICLQLVVGTPRLLRDYDRARRV